MIHKGYYGSNIKGIIGEGGREREGKEKWAKKTKKPKKTELRKKNGKKRHGREKKRTLEKTIRLHLALRGGVAPRTRLFAPAYRPVIGSIIIDKETSFAPASPASRKSL